MKLGPCEAYYVSFKVPSGGGWMKILLRWDVHVKVHRVSNLPTRNGRQVNFKEKWDAHSYIELGSIQE